VAGLGFESRSVTKWHQNILLSLLGGTQQLLSGLPLWAQQEGVQGWPGQASNKMHAIWEWANHPPPRTRIALRNSQVQIWSWVFFWIREQNIKNKFSWKSVFQSGKWNLAASKGQSVQLLPLHQSFPAASRSLSNFLREGISSWAGKHRQTDRPAAGPGSQLSLLRVSSGLRMRKELAYKWVPTGFRTEA
jgi:hypothetical protein